MRRFTLIVVLFIGLAFAAPPVAAGDWGVAVSSPGFGAYYNSRDSRHYRPRPPHRPHYSRPAYRPHYRPYYYRPSYRPVVCYPRPVYRSYYRPYYSSLSIGFGYWGSHGAVGISTTVPVDSYWAGSSYAAPTYSAEDYPMETGQYDSGYTSDIQYQAPRNRTVYEHRSNLDDRTIQQRAVYKGDKLLRSETYVNDNRPRGEEMQPGTNYTRDGRLRFTPQVPQEQETEKAQDVQSTRIQQASIRTVRASNTVAVPSNFRGRMVATSETASPSQIQAIKAVQERRNELGARPDGFASLQAPAVRQVSGRVEF